MAKQPNESPMDPAAPLVGLRRSFIDVRSMSIIQADTASHILRWLMLMEYKDPYDIPEIKSWLNRMILPTGASSKIKQRKDDNVYHDEVMVKIHKAVTESLTYIHVDAVQATTQEVRSYVHNLFEANYKIGAAGFMHDLALSPFVAFFSEIEDRRNHAYNYVHAHVHGGATEQDLIRIANEALTFCNTLPMQTAVETFFAHTRLMDYARMDWQKRMSEREKSVHERQVVPFFESHEGNGPTGMEDDTPPPLNPLLAPIMKPPPDPGEERTKWIKHQAEWEEKRNEIADRYHSLEDFLACDAKASSWIFVPPPIYQYDLVRYGRNCIEAILSPVQDADEQGSDNEGEILVPAIPHLTHTIEQADAYAASLRLDQWPKGYDPHSLHTPPVDGKNVQPRELRDRFFRFVDTATTLPILQMQMNFDPQRKALVLSGIGWNDSLLQSETPPSSKLTSPRSNCIVCHKMAESSAIHIHKMLSLLMAREDATETQIALKAFIQRIRPIFEESYDSLENAMLQIPTKLEMELEMLLRRLLPNTDNQ